MAKQKNKPVFVTVQEVTMNGKGLMVQEKISIHTKSNNWTTHSIMLVIRYDYPDFEISPITNIHCMSNSKANSLNAYQRLTAKALDVSIKRLKKANKNICGACSNACGYHCTIHDKDIHYETKYIPCKHFEL